MPAAIVGLIAAMGVPGLVTTTGALTTIGTVVSSVIGLGLSLGASYALQLLNQPKTKKPSDVQSVVRQSVPPRMKHYGRRRIGGTLAMIESWYNGLIQIIYLGEGPADAIEAWDIDDRVCTLQGETPVGFRGAGLMTIVYRLGTEDQAAFPRTMSIYPDLWTPAHQGKGCIAVELVARNVDPEVVNIAYPNKFPVLRATGRWAIIYDPRTGETKWSNNLALIMRDYLTHRDGLQIPAAYMDDEDFKQAAADSDSVLPTTSGGTVARYHGALSYALTDDPQDIIARLIRATDGRLIIKGSGKIGFSVGVWRAPDVTIPDGVLVSYELKDSSGPLQQSNEIVIQYENELGRYAQATAQPWRDEADISASGQTKTATLECYEIQNHNHARRIAKIAWHRKSPRWQGTVRTNLYGMKAKDERFIRLQVADLDIDDTFEVQSWSLDDNTMTVTMEVLSFDGSIYDFDPATEEGTPPTVPIEPNSTDLPPPQNVVVTGGRREITAGTYAATILVTWTVPANAGNARGAVEISLADADEWTPVAVSGGAVRAEAAPLQDGALYDVRVRLVGSGGTPSDWVLVENILATADPDAPAEPTGVTGETGPQPNGYTIRWTGPNSANFRAVRVYHATADNAASATVMATVYGAASQAGSYETASLSATTDHYFWVAAINGSGVESARVPAIF
ncbi:hypothetical protein [Labrys sp. (in: a-proteobacteria)]|uniref:hypothetical protein n=1 Tax=Labrys sp. (in: a-proteobacteria) TaxID=1917972 RepID=UPI0039E62CAD